MAHRKARRRLEIWIVFFIAMEEDVEKKVTHYDRIDSAILVEVTRK